MEQKLKEDIAISKEDYAFLVKYAGYEEAEEFVFCDQEMMDFMRQFGGATNTEELKLEDLRARIRENEAQLHKRIIKV